MARSRMPLVTDFRHLEHLVSLDDIEEGRSLPSFLACIVAAASLEEGPGFHSETLIPCRCRPRRKPCPGVIRIAGHRERGELSWSCSRCDFQGVITHWVGSSWDLTSPAKKKGGVPAKPQHVRREDPAAIAGRWRITRSAAWTPDGLDLLGPAFIEFDADGGSFRLITFTGRLDCRFDTFEGQSVADFSWSGTDENVAASGRGWVRVVEDGLLAGHLFIHGGTDSSFIAKRAKASASRKRSSRRLH